MERLSALEAVWRYRLRSSIDSNGTTIFPISATASRCLVMIFADTFLVGGESAFNSILEKSGTETTTRSFGSVIIGRMLHRFLDAKMHTVFSKHFLDQQRLATRSSRSIIKMTPTPQRAPDARIDDKACRMIVDSKRKLIPNNQTIGDRHRPSLLIEFIEVREIVAQALG